ncbi:MAG: hypothetical protein AABW75_03870 [Nanoarchaeota archaeon]
MAEINKVIVVLLILAIVFSVFSVILTLSLNNIKPVGSNVRQGQSSVGLQDGNVALNVESSVLSGGGK